MIKLFEQWLAEKTGEFTIQASTDKGEIDLDGVFQDELSSAMTAAYLVTASRTPVVETGDLLMISQKDKELGGKSDIIVSKSPSDLTDAVQLTGQVEIMQKKEDLKEN